MVTARAQNSETSSISQVKQRDDGGNSGKGQKGGGKGERSRQSFSCAECRRLKLKCSREWPCESCVKRGCGQICPNGELKTGQGRRLILVETEELHERIQQLEAALARSHAQLTSNPHPLLSDTHLFKPRPIKQKTPENEDSSQTAGDVMEKAFGILLVGADGHARFIGSLGGSEFLHQESSPGTSNLESAGHEGNDDHPRNGGLLTPPPSARRLPQSQDDLSYTDDWGVIGFETVPEPEVRRKTVKEMRKLLPNWEDEGKYLMEDYWDNVNWVHPIFLRSGFQSHSLDPAYDSSRTIHAHNLACVFFVMALGALFDLNKEPKPERGDELLKYGKECLAMVSYIKATLDTIQALLLYGIYLLNDNRLNGIEILWPLLGIAIKLAQSMGMHRDGEIFGLSSEEVKQRRRIWWELVTIDRLLSLSLGRPSGISGKSADVKYPLTADIASDRDHFHDAKYHLMTMCEKVIDLQTQLNPITVQQIRKIDADFSQFKDAIHEGLKPKEAIKDLPLDNTVHPHLVIHRFTIRLLIAQARLLLNRPLFARALGHNPEDPSQSRFGECFVALYESALEVIQLVKMMVIYHPSLISQWWMYWHHSVSACVCLAAITLRAPDSAFATPAYHALENMVDICSATKEGCRAKKALPMLLRLREKASESLNRAGKPQATQDSGVEDDLQHLTLTAALKTSQVSAKSKTPGSSQTTPPKTRVNGVSPQPVTDGSFSISPTVIRSTSSTSPYSTTDSSHGSSNTLLNPFLLDPAVTTQPFSLAGAVAPPPPEPDVPESAAIDNALNSIPTPTLDDNVIQMPERQPSNGQLSATTGMLYPQQTAIMTSEQWQASSYDNISSNAYFSYNTTIPDSGDTGSYNVDQQTSLDVASHSVGRLPGDSALHTESFQSVPLDSVPIAAFQHYNENSYLAPGVMPYPMQDIQVEIQATARSQEGSVGFNDILGLGFEYSDLDVESFVAQLAHAYDLDSGT